MNLNRRETAALALNVEKATPFLQGMLFGGEMGIREGV